MENEILENGTTETAEVQETVEVTETVETPETVEAPAENKTFVDTAKDTANKVVDKVTEVVKNPKDILAKIKAVPVKIWALIGGGIAAIVAAIVLISILTNTYKTPIKLMQAVENNKKASTYYSKQVKTVNGLCEKELKEIVNIMKKTDDYEDNLDDIQDAIDEAKDTYGNNYKYKYKIVDKEKIDRDDLKETQKAVRSQGKSMYNEFDDLDSDDYEDLADEMEISKSQAKKLAKAAKSIGKTLKGAKITAGYELTVEVTLTGSEVDEETSYERTVYVYKVNGRWVSANALTTLFYLF